MSESDVFDLAGTTLEGRFVVEGAVAEGGFGVVYRAQQVALERPIALKVLKTPPQFSEDAKQQFLAGFAAEAKTIARIAHPNIVQVYDFGVSSMPSGGRAAWMALEWLTGVTLEDELLGRRGRGGRSPAETLVMIRPVLSALAIVHNAGVAHRDLKPANLMLVPTLEGTTLKLLDFGIAKIMDANETAGTGTTQTRSNQIAFSPGYASPEQISNGRSGPWTDVHAMALVLTEMLIDRAPLKGNDSALLFQQIVDRERPTPGKFSVNVGTWEPVLARALAVSGVERYRDARDFLRALEDALPAGATAATTLVDDLPNRGSLRSPPVVDALSMGSTEVAPSVRSDPSLRSPLTTHAPMSGAAPPSGVAAAPRSRLGLYAGALAASIALAVVGAFALQASQHPGTGSMAPPPAVAAAVPSPSGPSGPSGPAPSAAFAPSSTARSSPPVSPAAPIPPAAPGEPSAAPPHSGSTHAGPAPRKPSHSDKIVVE